MPFTESEYLDYLKVLLPDSYSTTTNVDIINSTIDYIYTLETIL